MNKTYNTQLWSLYLWRVLCYPKKVLIRKWLISRIFIGVHTEKQTLIMIALYWQNTPRDFCFGIPFFPITMLSNSNQRIWSIDSVILLPGTQQAPTITIHKLLIISIFYNMTINNDSVVTAWDQLPAFLFNPLQLRHNGRDGVSNHQPHHCLLNRLFWRRSKKTSKLRVTGLCAGSPHKWPVTRRMFPFHNVIMHLCFMSHLLLFEMMNNFRNGHILEKVIRILEHQTLLYHKPTGRYKYQSVGNLINFTYTCIHTLLCRHIRYCFSPLAEQNCLEAILQCKIPRNTQMYCTFMKTHWWMLMSFV